MRGGRRGLMKAAAEICKRVQPSLGASAVWITTPPHIIVPLVSWGEGGRGWKLIRRAQSGAKKRVDEKKKKKGGNEKISPRSRYKRFFLFSCLVKACEMLIARSRLRRRKGEITRLLPASRMILFWRRAMTGCSMTDLVRSANLLDDNGAGIAVAVYRLLPQDGN